MELFKMSSLFLILIMLLVCEFYYWGRTLKFTPTLPHSYIGHREKLKIACSNVIEEMTVGHWVVREFAPAELQAIEDFLKNVRAHYGFPASLQREDNQCGKVTYQSPHWARAVCHPNGSTPCCWNSTCVSRSMEDCRCPDCYDMRQQIHAELAQWVPRNTECQMKLFSRQETCELLRNMTIVFVGDSLMRQFSIALFEKLRDNVLLDTTPKEMRGACDLYYKYMSGCTDYIIRDSLECNGTVHLTNHWIMRSRDSESILEVVRQLMSTTNSLLFMGIGLHDSLNISVVEDEVIKPMLKLLSGAVWPKVIWLPPHSPGLLKTPFHLHLQPDKIQLFNKRLSDVLQKQGIPLLNFFRLTPGVMSYDGTHYGQGVNSVKVNIFLNYFLENRKFYQAFSDNEIDEDNINTLQP